MRRQRPVLTLLLALAIGVTACSDDDGPETAHASSTTSSSAVTSTSTTSGTDPASTPTAATGATDGWSVTEVFEVVD